MYCKNCLAPLGNGDTYCKVCGKPVEQNTSYPSNEEIIKNYNVQESNAIFPEMPQPEPQVAPSPEVKAQPVEQPREIKPVQTLEQTNVMRPITAEEVNDVPVMNTTPVAPVIEPFTPNTEVPAPAPVRPEPLPIVNEKEGISKKVFIIGIIIAVVATALIAALISIPVISSKVDAAKKENEGSSLTPVTVKENRVLLSNYSFEIPEGFSYKVSGSQLIVENIATKEAMSLQIGTETYANLKTNLTTLKTNLTTAKWTIGKMYMDQNIKNRVYLTVEATVNKQKVMIAYTKANATQVFGIVYLNPTITEYPTDTIETFNDIVDSAEEITTKTTTTITNFTKNKLFFPKTTK